MKFFENFLLITLTLISITVHSQTVETKTLKMCNQVWMVTNLNVSHFLNGDSIRESKSEMDWKQAQVNKEPAWCFYNFSSENSKYGKLYNWYAVHDKRGLAPRGWHIPGANEWSELITCLDKLERKEGKEVNKSDKPFHGSLFKEFVSFPSGYYQEGFTSFSGLGTQSYWWTSEPEVSAVIFYFSETPESGMLFGDAQSTEANGNYVRCVKDLK